MVLRIPAGQVSNYGEVAARAGLPGRARLVGKVLGKTPDGVEVPWFRVLRADGRIAFPPQSRPYREQRARLIEEGVRVERGRVDLARFGWERNLDVAIWAPPVDAAASRKPAVRQSAGKSAAKKNPPESAARKTAREPAATKTARPSARKAAR